VDANQREIVAALRGVGCTVQHLHTVGQGCPDILVGCRGTNLLMELKDHRRPPSARKLTPDEVEWHERWRGQVVVVSSVEEALLAVASPQVGDGRGAPLDGLED
jgi:Holliday junction resolvase